MPVVLSHIPGDNRASGVDRGEYLLAGDAAVRSTELGDDGSLPKIEKIHSSMLHSYIMYTIDNESPRFSIRLRIEMFISLC